VDERAVHKLTFRFMLLKRAYTQQELRRCSGRFRLRARGSTQTPLDGSVV